MSSNPTNPLIVQSDRSVLLEVDNPLYEQARDSLSLFAELEKSPEHIHTYRITPLSIWNATAAGMLPEEIIFTLESFSKFPVPKYLRHEIIETAGRYGRIVITKKDEKLFLEVDSKKLAAKKIIIPQKLFGTHNFITKPKTKTQNPKPKTTRGGEKKTS